ncbi:uncharacterized protein METZ01_LOCUS464338, partial [marine metagenome]
MSVILGNHGTPPIIIGRLRGLNSAAELNLSIQRLLSSVLGRAGTCKRESNLGDPRAVSRWLIGRWRRLVPAAVIVLSAGAGLAQQTYKEAPELAALVAKGELPPVAHRLPAVPLVVEPYEEVGQYGGSWLR